MDILEKRRMLLKSKLKDCTIGEAIKISKLISPKFESVFNKYYFMGKSLRTISKENGTSHQSIQYRRDKAIEEILRIFGNKRFVINAVHNYNANNRVIVKLREKAKNILSQLDYEIEVSPYLKEEEKQFFDDFIFDFKQEEYEKLAGETVGQKNKSLFRRCRHILSIVKEILDKKNEQNKLFDMVGGARGLSDILPYLTEEEYILLDENLLDISPYANINFKKKYGLNSDELSRLKESFFNFIELFNKRKFESQQFIEENGGELFLLHEFGSTLDDADFYILTSTLMDYHYRTKQELSLEGAENEDYASVRGHFIKKKLKSYISRKEEIDKLVESLSGNKGLEKFCESLTDDEKTVLDYYTLSYNPCTKSQLQELLNKKPEVVNTIINNLDSKISSFLGPQKL